MSVIRHIAVADRVRLQIFQFFQKLKESEVMKSAHAARNFGTALVWLGIAMLVLGIAYT
jgi:putative membrane protein